MRSCFVQSVTPKIISLRVNEATVDELGMASIARSDKLKAPFPLKISRIGLPHTAHPLEMLSLIGAWAQRASVQSACFVAPQSIRGRIRLQVNVMTERSPSRLEQMAGISTSATEQSSAHSEESFSWFVDKLGAWDSTIE
jgi:hypothetical protein